MCLEICSCSSQNFVCAFLDSWDEVDSLLLYKQAPMSFFLSKSCFPFIQGKQLWHHSSFSCVVTLQVHTTLNMGQTAVLLGYLFFGKEVCAMALRCCDPGAQWRASSMLVLKLWNQWKDEWSKFSAAWGSKWMGRQAFTLSRLMFIRNKCALWETKSPCYRKSQQCLLFWKQWGKKKGNRNAEG